VSRLSAAQMTVRGRPFGCNYCHYPPAGYIHTVTYCIFPSPTIQHHQSPTGQYQIMLPDDRDKLLTHCNDIPESGMAASRTCKLLNLDCKSKWLENHYITNATCHLKEEDDTHKK